MLFSDHPRGALNGLIGRCRERESEAVSLEALTCKADSCRCRVHGCCAHFFSSPSAGESPLARRQEMLPLLLPNRNSRREVAAGQCTRLSEGLNARSILEQWISRMT